MCFDAVEVNAANSCMKLHEERKMTDGTSVCVCVCVGGVEGRPQTKGIFNKREAVREGN